MDDTDDTVLALARLPAGWVRWVEQLMVTNRMPLSGDVSQWIRTWGEAVSQIGLVNYHVVGTSNPKLERRISAEYSYGRQLGRILDVLAPLVDANAALFDGDPCGRDALERFRVMRREIEALKQARSVDAVVDEVRAWSTLPDYTARLRTLLDRLEGLEGLQGPEPAARLSSPTRPPGRG